MVRARVSLTLLVVCLLGLSLFAEASLGPFGLGRSDSKKAHIAGSAAGYGTLAAKSHTQVAHDLVKVRGQNDGMVRRQVSIARRANEVCRDPVP